MGIDDLFTNTPKKIVDRKWKWFVKNYGSTSSLADAISDPFKYMLVLVFNKMLDERLRFKLPVQGKSYWDFEVITEETFIKCRQSGKFKEIDFINSDFTGYTIKYFFDTKAYQKSYNIYLGGDLKRKFIENINNGVKYYSTGDFTIHDIIHLIYDRFPELTNKEIRDIIKFGIRRMHAAIRFGCALTFNTTKYGNCYVYIGKMSWERRKQIEEYILRKDRKLRKIDQWKKEPYQGYYYIGITGEIFDNWVKENKYSKSIVKFKKVTIKKIMEELYYKYPIVYIFRIRVKKYKGWSHWCEKIDGRETVYMGKAEKLKFSPAKITWKELIKQNETRNT